MGGWALGVQLSTWRQAGLSAPVPVHAGDGVMAKLVAATRRTAAVLVGALRAMNIFRAAGASLLWGLWNERTPN